MADVDDMPLSEVELERIGQAAAGHGAEVPCALLAENLSFDDVLHELGVVLEVADDLENRLGRRVDDSNRVALRRLGIVLVAPPKHLNQNLARIELRHLSIAQ